jgi:hypothetical protein
MTNPRKVLAIGVLDGVNKTYSTPSTFVAGTVVPFINGKASFGRKASETPPTTFDLTVAPLASDEVAVYYQEA